MSGQLRLPATFGELAGAVQEYRDADHELQAAGTSIIADRLREEADEAAHRVAEIAARYVDELARGVAEAPAPDPELAECSSCGARIRWRTHERTGKLAPIDAEPNPEGNVILLPGGRYAIDRAEHGPARTLHYTSHFATCPASAQHRRAAG